MNQTQRIKRVNKTTAVQKALENLREYIKDTVSEVLPNEDELSRYLGVSRLTVREATTVLEREGVVSRVQGKGTLINSFVTKLENRIDCGSDIEGCLRQNGYDVRFEVDELEFRKATKVEESKLGLNPEDSILVVKKILYANEMAAAVYIDRVPEKLLKTKKFTAEDLRPCIFPTIESLCQKSITHDVVQLYPHGADEDLARIFNIEINTPILRFDVLEYTSDSITLMYNTEFYTDKFIKFTLCRNVAYKE
ncbi:GntR family transcriptional regulator [Gottschalkia purinilytica]|uniref:GntR family transcriptional regulator n=1 Tax=Gottschalkia purinilytica TaxID=1503 RepID=A0A0L0WE33_GOTPU|nr:GntR family transcriptional regulator [Gottschalkia purinilytica]KNF09680.1 GntR family transcriptional regulator [Gottschalkia purinilytica]